MTYDDIPIVVELGRHMHEESSYRTLKYSPEKVSKFIESVLDDMSSLALVAEMDGLIVGMFGAHLTQHYFSYDLIAEDHVFYVSPSARGTSAAVRMIKQYMDWAIGVGAKFYTVGISCEVRNEITERFFEKLGFRNSGICMRRDNANE